MVFLWGISSERSCETKHKERERKGCLWKLQLLGLDALGCVKLCSSINFKKGAGWFTRALRLSLRNFREQELWADWTRSASLAKVLQKSFQPERNWRWALRSFKLKAYGAQSRQRLLSASGIRLHDIFMSYLHSLAARQREEHAAALQRGFLLLDSVLSDCWLQWISIATVCNVSLIFKEERVLLFLALMAWKAQGRALG